MKGVIYYFIDSAQELQELQFEGNEAELKEVMAKIVSLEVKDRAFKPSFDLNDEYFVSASLNQNGEIEWFDWERYQATSYAKLA